MKCKFTVDDGGDGRCSKNTVKKYIIDGESHFCRFHHYVYLSIKYAQNILELQEEIEELRAIKTKKALPTPISGVFTFDILDKITPPLELKLLRFTGRQETWHLSGSGPANQLMLISVNGSTIHELTTTPTGEWQFDLCDWHIPANSIEGQIRMIFPELHSDKGETYIINFTTNKIGKTKEELEHKHKPIRITGFGGLKSVICEQCGKWLKDIPNSDPQF